MGTEDFIKDAASRGWSKTQVRETLGLCRETFWAMLEAMPAMEWAPRGKSLGRKLSDEARRGYCSPALRAALAKTSAKRTELHSHTVDGVRGTIEQLAKLHGVSASTVRRRVNAGMGIAEALKTPATPLSLRRNSYGTAEHSARASL